MHASTHLELGDLQSTLFCYVTRADGNAGRVSSVTTAYLTDSLDPLTNLSSWSVSSCALLLRSSCVALNSAFMLGRAASGVLLMYFKIAGRTTVLKSSWLSCAESGEYAFSFSADAGSLAPRTVSQ